MIRLWPKMQWEDFLSETNPSGIVVDTLGRGIPMAQGEAALLLRVTYAPRSHLPLHTDPPLLRRRRPPSRKTWATF